MWYVTGVEGNNRVLDDGNGVEADRHSSFEGSYHIHVLFVSHRRLYTIFLADSDGLMSLLK